MNIKLATICALTSLISVARATVPPVDKGTKENAPAAATATIALDDVACPFENKHEDINKQAEHCDKIRKECMDKLPYKDLNQTCLSKLTFVEELGEGHFNAVLEGSVKHIPVSDKFVIKLVNTADWKKAPANFITEFLKTKELSDIFFKEFSKNPTKMAVFITETTVPALSLDACKQLGDENVINQLDANVFKKDRGQLSSRPSRLCFQDHQGRAIEEH